MNLTPDPRNRPAVDEDAAWPSLPRTSVDRAALESALESADGKAVVEAFRAAPRLRQLYEVHSGAWEGYSIGLHTEMVLSRMDKYPFANGLPGTGPVSAGDLRVIFALHDLAKFLPDGESCLRDKASQHARTLELIGSLRDELPLSDGAFAAAMQLVNGDPIGNLFRAAYPSRSQTSDLQAIDRRVRENGLSMTDYHATVDAIEAKVTAAPAGDADAAIEKIADEIAAKAGRCGMSPSDYLRLQTIYFQCDCSAYTRDAAAGGERAGLAMDFMYERDRNAGSPEDRLFLFDESQGRLRFSPAFEDLYRRLASRVAAG